VTFVFGVGIGNVSESSLGPNFTGRYFDVYGELILGALAMLIAETGMLGLGLILLLYAMIFRDSMYVAERDSGPFGALALGWTGVVAAMFMGMMQTNALNSPPLSMLFWYFSGVVVARRAQLEHAALAARRPTMPAMAVRRHAASEHPGASAN
jgi:hypothetical protein